ncbi:MAG: hypothetical protein M1834_007550 [Cirrosporium novae-zelandiae]|nr:MAG: hypothetical protein M1834_007550 [Cirrosporium novae-zelandiae]
MAPDYLFRANTASYTCEVSNHGIGKTHYYVSIWLVRNSAPGNCTTGITFNLEMPTEHFDGKFLQELSGKMALIRNVVLQALLFTLTCLISSQGALSESDSVSQWPLHDNGLNEVVQWDHYSLEVNGKRIFIFAGEFHYWRVPVPELWEDILQKIKAAGCNAFTFYAHWGYHHPNPDTLDFSNGAHDFTKLFTIAKKLGLYVIVRPGPYINAEANAGGYPLWLTTGDYGTLRNNDTRYTAAWKPYFAKVSEITSNYLITNGENAIAYQIENEYGKQWLSTSKKTLNESANAYMTMLEEIARENGIDIPLTHNDPNMNSKSWSKDFSNSTGNVDIAGLDSYPSCWSCNLDECTSTNGEYMAYKVVAYYDHFQEVSPTQPEFMFEFQGGSYNPWGGPEGGCPEDTGAEFANLFYRHNVAQRITAMNLYMFYGGTSWGSFAAPVVGTSYDYSSPISEDRSIGDKYYETKNLALFLRTARDLTIADVGQNSTNMSTNSAILTTELRNPDTDAGFYVTIHSNSSSSTTDTFKLTVNTTAGELTVPQKSGHIVLDGHQSKIIVTDFTFGSHSLLYSTAEVLSSSITDNSTSILALWVPTSESGEFFIKDTSSGTVAKCDGCSNIGFHKETGGLLVTFTQTKGMSILSIDSGSILVILLDRTYAYKFWAPVLTLDPFAPEDEIILVQGPYLVRDASISGNTIALTGDSSNTTAVTVFAPSNVGSISWNGKLLSTKRTGYGALIATIPAISTTSINLPALDNWKAHDSLPERLETYDDSGPAWVDANHTSTLNPAKPATYPVLYADEYGFHNGIHLWRGKFSGPASGVFLNVQGGTAFGWSAWLNGIFIGSFLGSSSLTAGNATLSFGNATVYTNTTNTLLVIQDNTGHDETTGALNPRGVLNATLLSPSSKNITFSSWKVAGTAGGSTSTLLDPMRGALAEGGLTAERLGWHLPDFTPSTNTNWTTSSPTTGFTEPGIRFYRTTFNLSLPATVDTSLAFRLSAPGAQTLRAQLFVNGYQYGRFNPYIGSQVLFPVPVGVLDYRGTNVVGLAVWAQTEKGAKVGVELVEQFCVGSGYEWEGVVNGTEYLRPGWSEEREVYV